MFSGILVEFKFPSKVDSTKNDIFPKNGVGSALFSRTVLVNEILDDVYTLDNESFYIRGPRGSGKTLLLCLIGRELQSRGETVYYIKHADALDDLYEQDVQRVEEELSEGKKLYLLIDEVHTNANDKMWNYLLKETNKTITIGFGLPENMETSPLFEKKYEPSFLMLTKKDFSTEEELQLLGHGANISDTSMLSDLVDWMLAYTGGHAFPFLKLCEHMLKEKKQFCEERKFESVVNSGGFYESPTFNVIVTRSYEMLEKTRDSAIRILETGVVSLHDASRMIKVGLWNKATNWFISNLLVSFLFRTY